LRKPAGIVLSLLFLAALAALLRSPGQQQPGYAHTSRLLFILPFENASNALASDWIGESFPEILNSLLSSSVLNIMSRENRLSASAHLGIPAAAKSSRTTICEVAPQLGADYLLIGSDRLEHGFDPVVNARLMDMSRLRLGAEITASRQLTNVVSIETAAALKHAIAAGLPRSNSSNLEVPSCAVHFFALPL
jgi:TolB-like protein